MSRIGPCFSKLSEAGDGALIVFVVAGHPDVKTSEEVLLAVSDAGADIIELGIPFSDPLADGPAIQAASQRALGNDVTPAGVLDMAARFRSARATPLVLMTCYNPIKQWGVERFAGASGEAGVDGVIVTDLPPEEADEWVQVARAGRVDTIFLLAPTSTEERMQKVVDLATGFVYCVSRMGVTGARADLPEDLERVVSRVRGQTAKPVAVGFGISRPEHVVAVCRLADGAVVGSAVVSLIEGEAGSGGAAGAAGAFVEQLKAATRGLRPAPVSR
jgi:tryptophan synthase alpha chain